VIPVLPQPEPVEFEVRVRQRGQAWILEKALNPNAPLPMGMEYPKPAYWVKQSDGYSCLEQLYQAYAKVCAYTGLFISSGAKSVDHFVPKSRLVGLAFEWGNYRLACRNINSRKLDFMDVLDPFFLVSETFYLVLETGEMYVNPNLENSLEAEKTIVRLGLNSEELMTTRAEFYADFKNNANHLRKYAPFVYWEAKRQDLLPLET
jgi:uncharacterized protein (TIGR02646 family)